ncbi:amino acid adenylation domain-containing protein [Streptomyces sp. NPDC020681]|uniref:amino acid adenylation domain-containing protein n=1 Tax=Streptomyces sp. NPDC020681 TaxID=3365083 RepID=UPI0037987B42
MSTSAQDDAGPVTDTPPAAVEDVLVFPASFAQARLWFLDQLAPGSTVYNVPLAIALTGPLDVRLLTDSLTEVVRRHEALRTTFADGDDGPLQIVRPPVPATIEVRDTTADALERAVTQETSRPFDLTAGPLLRTLLLRVSPTEHTLVVTFHHTVCDGWSIGVFCQELSSLYQAYALGFPSPLQDPEIQYADYAVWQRERLGPDALTDRLDYWRERLSGAPALLNLPTDRQRPAVASYRGAEVPVTVPVDLTTPLHQLARQERCTPFMLLLAAYQVLLARYSGQWDISVGTPVAGRDHSELEPLIGYFATTVVLRGQLHGDLTFRELLAHTRETTLADFEHQEVPFEQLVDALRPGRDIGHNPLFQAAFVLQNTDTDEVRLPGVHSRIGEPAADTAKFDLTLTLQADPDGRFTGTLEYATDLFDTASAAGLADSFHRLLEHAVTAPDTPLDRIPLTAADRAAEPVAPAPQSLTGTPPGTGAADSMTLTALFEERAARTPHACAVTTDGSQLSYAELNGRANRLARRLIAAGAGPDQLVALAMPRSAELIVALLAVLKSGAAYLPVDPSMPADRARHILADARPACVLTSEETVTDLLNGAAHTVLMLDDGPASDSTDVTDVTDVERIAPLSAGHLAYVIYTSGSTGRPKGVEISHRQVVRLLTTTEAEFTFGPDDVWSLFHSFAFDFSVWEIWGALAHGGTLAVVPAETARSPREFLDFLQRHRVTVLNQTPSAFRELTAAAINSPHLDQLPLRTVVFGGEALAVDDLAPWFDRLGDRCPDMVNMYGITETTVHVTHRRVQPNDLTSAVRSPIGHALGDLRLHLLDAHGTPVPRGVPGELYIGGPGLARGYRDRPALTAERFVPDPFGAQGERLYRSGDLCRWRTDGELEYLGRTDQQVKVRGFRIEPGEIEAALLEHPQVSQAAVLARADHAEDQQLVAYLVPESAEMSPDAVALRTHLQTTLPSYMVPSAYVVLPALPLTVNGKLDRAALPAPHTAPRATAAAYEPPRAGSEELLAEIWRDVLRVERVGAHDNFFDLGGHSFSALRLNNRLESAYDCTVPTAVIFQTPTLRGLAQWLDERVASTTVSPLVSLHSSGTRPPLFLVHPVGGHVFCYTGLAKALGTEQPVHALVARGMREDEQPAERIEDMAADYLAALEDAGHAGPFTLGGWSMGGVIAFEMARQLERRTGRTVPVVLIDSYAPQEYAPAADEADPDGQARLVADFADDWGRCTGTELGVRFDDLAAMPAGQHHAHLLAHAQRAGVLEPQDSADFVARLLDLFRVNRTALDRYLPATRHHGPLLLLSADDTGSEPAEPSRGWQHWTTAELSIRQMPGDHYSLLREPNLSRLAAQLRSHTPSGA